MQFCYVAGGSGSAYIYGFCDRNWRPGMSEADCEAFVKKAVGLALSHDGSSGGCIRTVVITKDGVRRSFLPNDKVNFPLISARLAVLDPEWLAESPVFFCSLTILQDASVS